MCSDCSPNWEPMTPRESADLEVFDNEPPKVRPAVSREQLAELAKGFAPVPPERQCGYVGCEYEAVNSHVCVRHERRVA